MYKSILACVSIVAIAGSTFLATSAQADELPAPTSSDAGAPSADVSAPVVNGGATSTDGQDMFKADFAWSVPSNPNGAAYTSCDVSLFRENGTLAFAAPYPADLPKLTLQFGATELTDAPIVPGTTGLSIHYTCTNGTDTSDEQTIDSIAVPDVPPTTPQVADVTAQGDDGLNVEYGGSKALGVAPLGGYQVSLERNGLDYANVVYGVDGKPVGFQTMTRGFSRMSVASLQGLAGNFDNLPAGTYTVSVRAYNSIGLSSPKVSNTQIVVNAKGSSAVNVQPMPNKIKSISTQVKAKSAKISWKAPVKDAVHANVARYVVTVALNGKTVQTKTVGPKATSLNLTNLKANKRYQVRVDAYGIGAAQVHIIKLFTTKKR